MKKTLIFIALSGLISACALTPQQKAEQAKEMAEKRLQLQVSLAQQCDPTAAKLMAQLPTTGNMSTAQKAAFDKNYEARVNSPVFQSCYNMAWKSYQEQNQLNMERQENMELQMDEGNPFWNEPFSCRRFIEGGAPYWYAC